MNSQDINSLIFWAVGLIVAVTVHEFMHAWTANYLGDNTAKLMGRLSLNPLVHLDPLGTLALLIFHFGWGKPVQINPNNFKNPKVGWALVSIAGPISNLITALVLSLPLKFGNLGAGITEFLTTIIIVNIVLMVFNLIPIPPLDGSKVLYAILPNSVDTRQLETYGPILLLALVFLGGGLIGNIINPAVNFFLTIMV